MEDVKVMDEGQIEIVRGEMFMCEGDVEIVKEEPLDTALAQDGIDGQLRSEKEDREIAMEVKVEPLDYFELEGYSLAPEEEQEELELPSTDPLNCGAVDEQNGEEKSAKRKRSPKRKEDISMTSNGPSPYSIAEILSMEGRTVEINKLIKSRGRPTPNISLHQTAKSGHSTHTRKFHTSSYDKWKWLCGCPEKNVLYCFPCVLVGGEGVWSRTGFQNLSRLSEKCDKHEKSKEHLQNTVSFKLFPSFVSRANTQSIDQHNQLVDKNRRILTEILKCLIFCAPLDLPLRGNEEEEGNADLSGGVFLELVRFRAGQHSELRDHLERSPTTYLSKASQMELLDCCYATYQAEIKKEIEAAKFLSVMAHETTKVSQTPQLVIVFRYLLGNDLKERFWGVFSPRSSDAEGISEVLLNELQKAVDDPDKVIGQTFEGAAVLGGEKNGVQVKVQSVYKYAYLVNCYAHHLGLILKSSARSKSSNRFFYQLNAISDFFSRSPNNLKLLSKHISNANDTASVPATRCNFNSQAVKTVKDNFEGLVSCLQEVEANLKGISVLNDSQVLLHHMNSDSFKFWLFFYCFIFNHISSLFKQLQLGHTDISTIKCLVEEFKKELNEVKENFINFDPNRTQDVTDIVALINEDISHRLAFKGHLMAEPLFDNKKFSAFAKVFPVQSLNFLVQAYPFFNQQTLRTELETIYSRKEFRQIESLVEFRRLLIDSNLNEDFGQTFDLTSILLTAPMTTVDPGRKFSTLERIEADLRNKLGEEGLSALAAISANKALFENSNTLDKIIDLFAESKERRMELIRK